MRRSMLAAAATLALAGAALPAASASAAEMPAPEIAWVGQHVVADGSDAYIQAKFRCYGARPEPTCGHRSSRVAPTRRPRARA